MRRLMLAACVGALLSAGYVISPIYTAWSIREAIRSGDSTYLARKIEWDGIKATLKPSLTRMALDLPVSADGEPLPRASLWSRLKGHYGSGVVDRFVEAYVTPERLPELFTYGKAYRETVKGQVDDTAGLPLQQRIAQAWARVRRAEFESLTRFRIEMVDRYAADRLYAGLLEIRGFEWKLTELRVRPAPETAPATNTDSIAQSID